MSVVSAIVVAALFVANVNGACLKYPNVMAGSSSKQYMAHVYQSSKGGSSSTSHCYYTDSSGTRYNICDASVRQKMTYAGDSKYWAWYDSVYLPGSSGSASASSRVCACPSGTKLKMSTCSSSCAVSTNAYTTSLTFSGKHVAEPSGAGSTVTLSSSGTLLQGFVSADSCNGRQYSIQAKNKGLCMGADSRSGYVKWYSCTNNKQTTGAKYMWRFDNSNFAYADTNVLPLVDDFVGDYDIPEVIKAPQAPAYNPYIVSALIAGTFFNFVLIAVVLCKSRSPASFGPQKL